MKKRIAFLIALIFSFGFIFTAVPTPAAEIYLTLGDSISTGYGLEDVKNSFANKLADKGGFTLYNYAADGSTAADVLALLESGEIDEVIASAEVITLTCGGNDLMKLFYEQVAIAYNKTANAAVTAEDVRKIFAGSADAQKVSLALTALSVLTGNGDDIPAIGETAAFNDALTQYERQLRKIIVYMKEHNKKAQIIVATQYNPYKAFSGAFSDIRTHIGSCVVKLNNIITSCAASEGYKACDVYAAFESNPENLCNADAQTMDFDFHPNASGHSVIAECIGSLISPKNIGSSFADVKPDDWFFEAVQYATEKKLLFGVSEGEFAPYLPLTRAMLVTILYRAEGTPPVENTAAFSDVYEDSYYCQAVNWAKKSGIVTGYSDTVFAPDDYITREQIAVIMLRYANFKEVGPVGAWAIRLDYKDLAQVSEYAGEAVMYCTMKGIMQGKDEQRFAPKDYATRAEAAVILHNFYNGLAAI